MQTSRTFQGFYTQFLAIMNSRYVQVALLISALLLITLAIVLELHLASHIHTFATVQQPIKYQPMEGPVD